MSKPYEYGSSSLEKLNTCHPDLIKIAQLVIKRTKIDIGISEGHRPVERQQFLYSIGRTIQLYKQPVTNVDGVKKKGKHNYKPSKALDFYVYHPSRSVRTKIAYDTNHLCYIAGIFDSCAKELYDRGEISYLIRWGGNWDQDGVIAYDQSFDDMPHVELYKPR